MSRCELIRNQFFLEPDGSNTYCCQSVPKGSPERKQFNLGDWEEKRKYELDLYEQSKVGWLTECLLCKHKEERTGNSMRTFANEEFKDIGQDTPHITEAIIKTSNHCNLGCRMCGPSLSTFWQTTVRNNPNDEFASDLFTLEETTDADFEILKEKVFTPHLRSIIFSGGESLLSKKNYSILQHLLDTNLCENINLHITTNGSVKIKDAWLTSASRFNEFTMEFSIDGAGSVYDYIRPGANWKTLLDVIQYTKDVAMLDVRWQFNYVAQALNAHSMSHDKEMIMGLFSDVSLAFPDWDDSVSVCYDEEDSYKVIHPKLRDKYCIQEIAEPFEYSEEVYAKFMRKMAWLDNAHGTSLQEHNPDFFDIDVYPEYAIIEYNKVKR